MVELILGPPGTGKTTTLLGIVDEELARGVAPGRIGYVTFTRRGAEEAVTRACARFGLERRALPHFRTLHSLCFRALGIARGDVLDGQRLQNFAAYAGVDLRGRWAEDGTLVGDGEGLRAMMMENLARIRGVALREQYDSYSDGLRWKTVEHMHRALVYYKGAEGVVDYTDMLARFVTEGHGLDLEVLVVDEAQDLSHLQWEVVGQLARGCRRVVVAGDDDQAIYRWAGADVEHLVGMEGDAMVLGQSWRCPRAVQDLAMRLIGRVRARRPKEWAAREANGSVDSTAGSLRDLDLPGQWTDGGKQPILILARNEFLITNIIIPELRRRGIIYERHGVPAVPQRVLDAVVAWEDLRAGRSVSVAAALRVYAMMSSGLGVRRGHKELPGFDRSDSAPPVVLADLRERGGLLVDSIWHDALDKLPEKDMGYLYAARRAGERLGVPPRVRVSTVHGSKGGEAEHVVLLKEMARRSHDEIERAPEDEMRVWYVAVTRARERLTIVGDGRGRECPWL